MLGNIVTELAHLFDDAPSTLSIEDLNNRLVQLLADLNDQIDLPIAEPPPVTLDPGQFLELTVPAIDLDPLGLLLKTSPITVDAFAQTGDGNLLGNLLDALLNTIDATPGNLTALSNNLNALLAKVVGVLNAADLSVSQSTIDALPEVLQTLLSPVVFAPTAGATTQILDLVISSPDETPPVQADLLGLVVTTSDIDAELWAKTGDGDILGNLLFNVANLLNEGNPASLLFLLAELADLYWANPADAAERGAGDLPASAGAHAGHRLRTGLPEQRHLPAGTGGVRTQSLHPGDRANSDGRSPVAGSAHLDAHSDLVACGVRVGLPPEWWTDPPPSSCSIWHAA